MKIGFFGGSFDPVHRGHLAAAADARDGALLDRVVLVPAAQAPLRSGAPVAAAVDRLAMLRLVAHGESWLDVSDYELRREGISYTIETARFFHDEFPKTELYWIIGADQLRRLTQWRQIEELVHLVQFVTLERPGYPVERAPDVPGLRLLRVPGRQLDISSTRVREHLRRGEPVDEWVPHNVVVYLTEKGLYL